MLNLAYISIHVFMFYDKSLKLSEKWRIRMKPLTPGTKTAENVMELEFKLHKSDINPVFASKLP